MALVGRIWTCYAAILTFLGFLLIWATVFVSVSHREQPRVVDVLAAPAIQRRSAFDLSVRDVNTTEGIHGRAPKGVPPCAPASDEVYNRAREKGELLICYMKNPSAAGDLQTSKWNDFDDLKEWGWTETTTSLYGPERKAWFQAIVGDVESSNKDKNVRLDHVKQHPDQEVVQPDGSRVKVSYPPTEALYENKMWPDYGIIIGDSNWGPRSRISDEATSKGKNWDPATMRQPDLSQLSDIWWLMWKKYTTPAQLPKVRYMVQNMISNEPSKEVIARALQQHWPDDEHIRKGQAPAWPGKVFTPAMEGFAALLGTANLWGIPFFLIQHGGDGQLGRLEVKKITVYTELLTGLPFYSPNAVVEVGKVEG